MNFVSIQQLAEDIRRWSSYLPADLVAVCGIPRSGVLPAVQLALHRNIHLVTLDDICAGRRPWMFNLRRRVPAKTDGRVLIVDDSIRSGTTIDAFRKVVPDADTFVYGVLYYADPDVLSRIDTGFREICLPRCFEWNLFHCNQIQFTCIALEGVLCEKWCGRGDGNTPSNEVYRAYLEHARPRFLPHTHPVLSIITSRLEKYRGITEAWLRRHGVHYGSLIMAPYETTSERGAVGDEAGRKAAHYSALRQARLFIESDLREAREIAKRTNRPVLCADTMEML